ncbi:GntR family transcriptional regulator [Clostridium sp. KNHs216]|jgi:Predicted transcriptional regulators|uniref:GntR family transcriptional regulator n=1 Tax=Eubacteriales TaxID=186802 RepID=UPI000AB737A3|nr:GntR family transcriptional regulator [Clostridium sp. KNHs216]TQI67105.1 GntR family transcriptional regulator [Clostridium sp. KNHs216]
MVFTLDYKSRLPIYEQLYRSIRRMAAVGAVDQREPLPSVRALAQELGVNPNTVQKAYRMLEHDGIICSIPGKGSFLSEDLSAISQQREIALEKLDDAIRSAADFGITKSQIIVRVESIVSGRGE